MDRAATASDAGHLPLAVRRSTAAARLRARVLPVERARLCRLPQPVLGHHARDGRRRSTAAVPDSGRGLHGLTAAPQEPAPQGRHGRDARRASATRRTPAAAGRQQTWRSK